MRYWLLNISKQMSFRCLRCCYETVPCEGSSSSWPISWMFRSVLACFHFPETHRRSRRLSRIWVPWRRDPEHARILKTWDEHEPQWTKLKQSIERIYISLDFASFMAIHGHTFELSRLEHCVVDIWHGVIGSLQQSGDNWLPATI